MEFHQEVKYKILSNPKLGRYLVAENNLQKGSLIFTDVPFVIGPKLGILKNEKKTFFT